MLLLKFIALFSCFLLASSRSTTRIVPLPMLPSSSTIPPKSTPKTLPPPPTRVPANQNNIGGLDNRNEPSFPPPTGSFFGNRELQTGSPQPTGPVFGGNQLQGGIFSGGGSVFGNRQDQTGGSFPSQNRVVGGQQGIGQNFPTSNPFYVNPLPPIFG
ncbi:unnamed protein product [Caenorhabditis bovis]|uniref:Uncharacterized protein n=1 Tax=Caenorhabditis bovis TaxID=2654633 RepID=A0A8S1FA75_9PELO|nr:unnamed protein product [Caenorhabditis bovis]